MISTIRGDGTARASPRSRTEPRNWRGHARGWIERKTGRESLANGDSSILETAKKLPSWLRWPAQRGALTVSRNILRFLGYSIRIYRGKLGLKRAAYLDSRTGVKRDSKSCRPPSNRIITGSHRRSSIFRYEPLARSWRPLQAIARSALSARRPSRATIEPLRALARALIVGFPIDAVSRDIAAGHTNCNESAPNLPTRCRRNSKSRRAGARH